MCSARAPGNTRAAGTTDPSTACLVLLWGTYLHTGPAVLRLSERSLFCTQCTLVPGWCTLHSPAARRLRALLSCLPLWPDQQFRSLALKGGCDDRLVLSAWLCACPPLDRQASGPLSSGRRLLSADRRPASCVHIDVWHITWMPAGFPSCASDQLATGRRPHPHFSALRQGYLSLTREFQLLPGYPGQTQSRRLPNPNWATILCRLWVSRRGPSVLSTRQSLPTGTVALLPILQYLARFRFS